jgi:hypothetical protein
MTGRGLGHHDERNSSSWLSVSAECEGASHPPPAPRPAPGAPIGGAEAIGFSILLDGGQGTCTAARLRGVQGVQEYFARGSWGQAAV